MILYIAGALVGAMIAFVTLGSPPPTIALTTSPTSPTSPTSITSPTSLTSTTPITSPTPLTSTIALTSTTPKMGGVPRGLSDALARAPEQPRPELESSTDAAVMQLPRDRANALAATAVHLVNAQLVFAVSPTRLALIASDRATRMSSGVVRVVFTANAVASDVVTNAVVKFVATFDEYDTLAFIRLYSNATEKMSS